MHFWTSHQLFANFLFITLSMLFITHPSEPLKFLTSYTLILCHHFFVSYSDIKDYTIFQGYFFTLPTIILAFFTMSSFISSFAFFVLKLRGQNLIYLKSLLPLKHHCMNLLELFVFSSYTHINTCMCTQSGCEREITFVEPTELVRNI